MDKVKMRMFFFTVFAACVFTSVSYAQPSIKTAVDKNDILIGDQFKLTIEAKFSPDDYTVNWPAIPDSLPHFEVISRSKLDSVYNSNTLSGVKQVITLTSFDSGKWVLPSFLVNMVPVKQDSAYSFFTDSVPVTVSFSTSDTTNVIKDIKPIKEVETINPLWYWIGASVLLIALIIFLIWFYRYWKKNKGTEVFKTKLSPYDEAIAELEKLKLYDLTSATDTRLVHTKMAEIFKRYLSRVQKSNFQNKTTGDVLIALRDENYNEGIIFKLAASLRCSDAVKFAKYLPPVSESETSLQSVKESIKIINEQAFKPTPSINAKPSK